MLVKISDRIIRKYLFKKIVNDIIVKLNNY